MRSYEARTSYKRSDTYTQLRLYIHGHDNEIVNWHCFYLKTNETEYFAFSPSNYNCVDYLKYNPVFLLMISIYYCIKVFGGNR